MVGGRMPKAALACVANLAGSQRIQERVEPACAACCPAWHAQVAARHVTLTCLTIQLRRIRLLELPPELAALPSLHSLELRYDPQVRLPLTGCHLLSACKCQAYFSFCLPSI